VANVAGLLGVTVGLARGAPGVLVAVVAVLLQVLFCIALARFVTTSMAGLLRSRRGKDLAAFMVIPIFALYEFFTQVVPRVAAEGKISASSFAGVDSWLRWLPPGLAAHAIGDASDGHPGLAVARLALLAAVIVVLVWLWVRSLRRALVTADTSTQSSRVRGAALPLAGAGLRGTVAARFWLYQRRDPLSLVYWVMTAVIMIAASISTLLGRHHHPGIVIFSAVLGAGFVGAFHANAVGFTGEPFVLEALALSGRRQLRSYFSGQDVVLGVVAVPLLAVVSFGLAFAARDPAEGFVALAAGLAGLGAALGVANIFTAVLPYPMAKRAGSPMPQSAQGSGAYALGSNLGTLAGVGVAAAPVIVAANLTGADPAGVRVPVLLVCAAAYGLALAWIGLHIAARAAEGRLPELCQVAIRTRL
jgi:ABC-2 type transport system permease protein